MMNFRKDSVVVVRDRWGHLPGQSLPSFLENLNRLIPVRYFRIVFDTRSAKWAIFFPVPFPVPFVRICLTFNTRFDGWEIFNSVLASMLSIDEHCSRLSASYNTVPTLSLRAFISAPASKSIRVTPLWLLYDPACTAV
jgi:hypothetical protein